MTRKLKMITIISSMTSLIVTIALIFGLVVIPEINKQKKREEIMRNAKSYYDQKVAQFEEENNTLTNVDIAFVGDSLTDGYDTKRFFSQYKTANRGIGGDTTFGVEKRLKVSVYDISPKVVTLLIGINNINTMFENYESILQQLKENLPNSKIVLLSLTAMTSYWAYNNEKAILANQKIKVFAKEYGFEFVDLFTPLCNPETNELYEEYTIDGGHFTEQGYQVITNTLTPVFERLLSTS